MDRNKTFPVDLNGQVAVVTGGGGILCSCMAKALAQCGAAVAILDLKLESAQRVANEITQSGGRAIPIAANVLDETSLKTAAAAVQEQLGDCDILINGAGGNHPDGTTSREQLFPEDLSNPDEKIKTFFDLNLKGVGFVFDLNFLGTLLTTQVFGRRMAENGHGVVLNISSMNAFTPLTKIPAYSAAKAAVSNFTEWLAVHFAPVGIRVNALAPGFFLTDQNRAMLTNLDGTLTERGKKILANTPMKRFGAPEELIGGMLFLVDDHAASFVNGVVLPIDGAFHAYSGV